MFPENGVGGNFGFGGRARKITPLIYPLIFKNFFGHENSRHGSCGAAIFFVLLEISSRGPFELKSDVASLFCIVFWPFLGQNFGQNFWFFLGVR